MKDGSHAGVTRKILGKISLPCTEAELIMTEVTYSPGVKAPPHRHPVGGLVFIVEGSAETAYGDDPPTRRGPGDVLIDEPERVHTLFRNCDDANVLRFIAVFVAKPEEDYFTAV